MSNLMSTTESCTAAPESSDSLSTSALADPAKTETRKGRSQRFLSPQAVKLHCHDFSWDDLDVYYRHCASQTGVGSTETETDVATATAPEPAESKVSDQRLKVIIDEEKKDKMTVLYNRIFTQNFNSRQPSGGGSGSGSGSGQMDGDTGGEQQQQDEKGKKGQRSNKGCSDHQQQDQQPQQQHKKTQKQQQQPRAAPSADDNAEVSKSAKGTGKRKRDKDAANKARAADNQQDPAEKGHQQQQQVRKAEAWEQHYVSNKNHFFPIKNYIFAAFPSMFSIFDRQQKLRAAAFSSSSSSLSSPASTSVPAANSSEPLLAVNDDEAATHSQPEDYGKASAVRNPPFSILDAGCGTGSVCLPLMKHFLDSSSGGGVSDAALVDDENTAVDEGCHGSNGMETHGGNGIAFTCFDISPTALTLLSSHSIAQQFVSTTSESEPPSGGTDDGTVTTTTGGDQDRKANNSLTVFPCDLSQSSVQLPPLFPPSVPPSKAEESRHNTTAVVITTDAMTYAVDDTTTDRNHTDDADDAAAPKNGSKKGDTALLTSSSSSSSTSDTVRSVADVEVAVVDPPHRRLIPLGGSMDRVLLIFVLGALGDRQERIAALRWLRYCMKKKQKKKKQQKKTSSNVTTNSRHQNNPGKDEGQEPEEEEEEDIGILCFRDYGRHDHAERRFISAAAATTPSTNVSASASAVTTSTMTTAATEPTQEGLVAPDYTNTFFKGDGTCQHFFELQDTLAQFKEAGLVPISTERTTQWLPVPERQGDNEAHHGEEGEKENAAKGPATTSPPELQEQLKLQYHCNTVVNRKTGQYMAKVFVNGAFVPTADDDEDT